MRCLALGKFGNVVVGGEFFRETFLKVDRIGTARIAFADGGADVGQQLILIPARSDGTEGFWHVVERGRLGNLYVGEVFLIARCVLEIIMWRLELVADKERLVLIVLRLEPVSYTHLTLPTKA